MNKPGIPLSSFFWVVIVMVLPGIAFSQEKVRKLQPVRAAEPVKQEAAAQAKVVKQDAEKKEGEKEKKDADEKAPVSLVKRGSKWRFFAEDKMPEGKWTESDYDDSKWKEGEAPFGYGDEGMKTELEYGEDEDNKWPSAYFRKKIEIDADLKKFDAFAIRARMDDGGVFFINGKEVGRLRMPEKEEIDFDTHTTSKTGGNSGLEGVFELVEIKGEHLKKGENALAVRLHQGDDSSSDLAFDLELFGLTTKQLTAFKKEDEKAHNPPPPVVVNNGMERMVMNVFDQRIKQQTAQAEYQIKALHSILGFSELQKEELNLAVKSAVTLLRESIKKDVEEKKSNNREINSLYQRVSRGSYALLKNKEFSRMFDAILDDEQRESYRTIQKTREREVRRAAALMAYSRMASVLFIDEEQKKELLALFEKLTDRELPNQRLDIYGNNNLTPDMRIAQHLSMMLSQSDSEFSKLLAKDQRELLKNLPAIWNGSRGYNNRFAPFGVIID